MDTRFAVDIGGTFTDLVTLDQSGNLRMAKAPSTPKDPTQGVLETISKAQLSLPEIKFFIHGTTSGINALLQRKGATVGLITSDGFRDVLEMGRTNWPLYQLSYDKPAPLVPRYLRCEVPERISAKGETVRPLDEEAVRRSVEKLKRFGVDAIAVCFLHAYADASHEERVAEIIKEVYPEASISLSHEVTRQYREYERTSTTVLNAYLQPVMEAYLEKLADSLSGQGLGGEFLITRSDGGLMSQGATRRRSLQTIHSGPASGVMGAANLGKILGFQKIISADMGGTSFDAALINNGVPLIEQMTAIEGLPILVPSISIATIGAGGGSIAHVDAAGALQVGPESAGADPGPVCYGKGGTTPTFTDAALCNGFIDPNYFLGGDIRLNGTGARTAIEQNIASPMAIDIGHASQGVMKILETKMAGVLHEICIGQGHDPREFVLIAFGGGGPLVAGSLAEKIGIPRVVIPKAPGNFSAWGMLMLDIVHEFSRTYVTPLNRETVSIALRELATLQNEAVNTLAREGVERRASMLFAYFDIRYEMQEHTISVPIQSDSRLDTLVTLLKQDYQSLHKSLYGYTLPYDMEIVNIRVRAVGQMDKPKLQRLKRGSGKSLRAKSTRAVWFTNSKKPIRTNVYERASLLAGHQISGPALIEESTSVTVVNPGQRVVVEPLGSLIIHTKD